MSTNHNTVLTKTCLHYREVSHDINNVLSAIIGYCNLLFKANSDKTLETHLTQIRDKVDMMVELTKELSKLTN